MRDVATVRAYNEAWRPILRVPRRPALKLFYPMQLRWGVGRRIGKYWILRLMLHRVRLLLNPKIQLRCTLFTMVLSGSGLKGC